MTNLRAGTGIAGMAAIIGAVLILAAQIAGPSAAPATSSASAPAAGAEVEMSPVRRPPPRTATPLVEAVVKMVLAAATGLGLVYLMFSVAPPASPAGVGPHSRWRRSIDRSQRSET